MIDNSQSKIDLSALFGGAKKPKKQNDDDQQAKPLQNDEYEFEWGRGRWLSVLNDALFQDGGK